MLRILQAASLALLITICGACGPRAASSPAPLATSAVVPTRLAPPTPAPTAALDLPGNGLIFKNAAMGITKDGQSIVILTVQIAYRGNETEATPGGYDTANKMLVARGGSLFWLKSSNTPDKFGCSSLPVDPDFTDNARAEKDRQRYELFGCYFGSAELSDMDNDGEPEIVAAWFHGGTSSSVNSYHFYRWDGRAYQLIDDIFEVGLHIELRDLDGDGKLEVIAQYEVGDTKWYPVPWVDVYAYSHGQLIPVNRKYAGFYQGLLAQYEQLLPRYRAVPTAFAELKHRIEMASAIVDFKP